MFVVDTGAAANHAHPVQETLLLVHGFPTSSFDYHKVWPRLEAWVAEAPVGARRAVAFDHVGFGFSAKPDRGGGDGSGGDGAFSYSLHDHAEHALELWRQLSVSRARIVAHDMGDSVITEILARYERGLLPPPFTRDFFAPGVTFTNGGMLVEHINFRLTQRVLLAFPWASRVLAARDRSSRVSEQQLASVWGSAHADMHDDIRNIIAINRVDGGMQLMGELIYYLHDRYRFQARWLDSLRRIDVNITLAWTADDAVSPLIIPRTLARHINPRHVTLRPFVHGVGHFPSLEAPDTWLKMAGITTSD